MKKVFYFLLMLMAVVSLSACSSDDDGDDNFSINEKSVSLKARTGETTLESTAKGVTWNSENTYIAVVNQSGKVTALHVGETNIVASKGSRTLKCHITVTPNYETYVEPITEFGKSRSYIVQKLGSPDREATNDGREMIYYGQTDSYQVTGYTFENDKLVNCTVALQFDIDKATQIPLFLLDRYESKGTYTNGILKFYNASQESEATVFVYFDSVPNANHIWIYYMNK